MFTNGFFVLGVFILVSNVMVILATLLYRNARFLQSNVYIVSLAVSDGYVGISGILGGVLANSGLRRIFDENKFLCIFFLASGYGSAFSSQLHVCLIAVDRYLFIMKPLHYQFIMTPKKVFGSVALTWLVSFAYATIPFFFNYFDNECQLYKVIPAGYRLYGHGGLFCFCLLSTAVLYMAIAKKALQHKKVIFQAQCESRRNTRNSSVFLQSSGRENGRPFYCRHRHSRRISVVKFADKMRTFKMFTLVVGLFFACWVPVFVADIVWLNEPKTDSKGLVRMLCLLIALSHSGVNVFVYAGYDKAFRRSLVKILTCGKLSTQYTDSSSGSLSRESRYSRNFSLAFWKPPDDTIDDSSSQSQRTSCSSNRRVSVTSTGHQTSQFDGADKAALHVLDDPGKTQESVPEVTDCCREMHEYQRTNVPDNTVTATNLSCKTGRRQTFDISLANDADDLVTVYKDTVKVVNFAEDSGPTDVNKQVKDGSSMNADTIGLSSVLKSEPSQSLAKTAVRNSKDSEAVITANTSAGAPKQPKTLGNRQKSVGSFKASSETEQPHRPSLPDVANLSQTAAKRTSSVPSESSEQQDSDTVAAFHSKRATQRVASFTSRHTRESRSLESAVSAWTGLMAEARLRNRSARNQSI